ncbi:hypothetical protein KJ671_00770 [Patescibacteria group bacterium]|nr:hypothetical protein [Patescibacteria group bacterium]
MTLKIRRLTFYFLSIVFIILAFVIIPYSNGWRFDIKTFNFVKLGGIYLEVEPIESQIKIDDLSIQRMSNFMKSGILITNLFPKKYNISVKKEGYQSWSRNVIVKPSLVTQIHPIILLPQLYEKEILAEDIINVFPGKNYLILKNKYGILKINDKIIKGEEFVAWINNDKLALTLNKITNTYFVIDVDQKNTALNINLIFENLKYQKSINDICKINKILKHPFDKNKLIISTDQALYSLDFNRFSLEIIKNGQPARTTDVVQSGGYNLLGISNKEIFFADRNNLYSYDLYKKETISILQQKNLSGLEISPDNKFIAIIDNNDKLLLIDYQNPVPLRKLEESNVSYFKFSPDSKKISIVNNDNTIKVFFIGDDYELFNKKLFSLSSFKIGLLDNLLPITWHSSSSYLFVKYPISLYFLEINDNLPINLQLVDASAEKYFYNSDTEDIYLLEQQKLYKTLNE